MTHSIWYPLNTDSAITIVEKIIGQKLSNLCITRNSYINRVYEMETIEKERFIVKNTAPPPIPSIPEAKPPNAVPIL